MVDGGQSYIRRSISGYEEDMSIFATKSIVKACTEAVDWGKDNHRNSLGIALAVIRALRDSCENFPLTLKEKDNEKES